MNRSAVKPGDNGFDGTSKVGRKKQVPYAKKCESHNN